MAELNVKVGDRVAYHHHRGGWNSYNSSATIEEVTRVTPTGRIKLKNMEGVQFDKYGRKMGSTDIWSRGFITELTPEIEEKILHEKTIEKCYQKIRGIKKLDYSTAVKILDALETQEALKDLKGASK